jgi:plastocyanin
MSVQKHDFALVVAALAGLACFVTSARAQTWGDLEIDVFLKGDHKPAKIDPTKDPEFCGKHPLVDERLTVDPKTKAIANLAVYLFPGTQKVTVHPDYAKTAKEKKTVDNKNCRFEPHVLAVRTGQPLVIGNSDSVGHNTKAEFFDNPSFNDLIPAGGKVEKTFGKAETGAVKLDCNIHPWMNAFLFVRDDPYIGISDAKGHISIKNLPAGELTFVVWNYANLPKVTIDGKETTLGRGGKWKTTIKPGANKYKFEVDLKDVKLN